MTPSKDVTSSPSAFSAEQLAALMAATGLPEHVAIEMLRSDQNLDELCDTVLSMFATDGKKVAITGR